MAWRFQLLFLAKVVRVVQCTRRQNCGALSWKLEGLSVSCKRLVQTVTGQVGGLSYRSSPTGWKQAQGSVGNMQATLYAQIRTLIADVKSRYEDVEISVQSPLYPWLLRHAQLLINRYLQKSDGLNAYERRWNRKYHGSICNFGETLTLRVANVGKTQLS